MRIGFHLEAESDKDLIRAFLRKLTGHSVNESPALGNDESDLLTGRQQIKDGPLAGAGDGFVLKNVHAACRDFHGRDFRGIVVGVDNDESLRHESNHPENTRQFAADGCRYCRIIEQIPASFNPRHERVDPFVPIISVPVEMIESWVLFAKGFPDPEQIPKSELKMKLYGTRYPSTGQIRDAALPLIESMTGEQLSQLEEKAPSFGFFATHVQRFVESHKDHLCESPWERA